MLNGTLRQVLAFVSNHAAILMLAGIVLSFMITTPWLIYKFRMIDKMLDEIDEDSLGAGDGCE